MSFHYVTRTVQTPVRASGAVVLNRHDEIVATTETSFMASALADLINLGAVEAAKAEAGYDAAQRGLASYLLRNTDPGPDLGASGAQILEVE